MRRIKFVLSPLHDPSLNAVLPCMPLVCGRSSNTPVSTQTLQMLTSAETNIHLVGTVMHVLRKIAVECKQNILSTMSQSHSVICVM